tara:strand:- start:2769 stop:3083 length:315 start_codon:yes stop_codon:yes gene_type:complete
MIKYFFVFLMISTNLLSNSSLWIGKWIASDEWQSEFEIILHSDGQAESNYADGDIGKWKIIDSNVEINWDSGKRDYIFSGVMGIQRLSDNKGKKYTSGMKKLLN